MKNIQASMGGRCPKGIALCAQMPASENSSSLLRSGKAPGLSGRYVGSDNEGHYLQTRRLRMFTFPAGGCGISPKKKKNK